MSGLSFSARSSLDGSCVHFVRKSKTEPKSVILTMWKGVILHPMEITVVNGMNAIPLYAKKTWVELGKLAEIWERVNYGGCFAGYLEVAVVHRRKTGRGRFPYCVVVLDNDYVEWLNEVGRRDNGVSFKKYTETMLVSEMRGRLKKSGLSRFYECVFMPVRLTGNGIIWDMKLTERERRSLEKYVRSVYRDCDCYVTPYIAYPKTDSKTALCEQSRAYFEEGKPFAPAWGKTNPDLAYLCVPVFISGRYKEAVYKREDIIPGGRFCLERQRSYCDKLELFRRPPGASRNWYKRELGAWEDVVSAFAEGHSGALSPQSVFVYGDNIENYNNYIRSWKTANISKKGECV